MADNNNASADHLPLEPSLALKSLNRLVGVWKATGSYLEGTMTFAWMDGGFFFLQHVDAYHGDRQIRGVEYIGFDDDTQTLRSHYMDTHGSNFAYTWELAGDTLRIWFGDKGSNNNFVGTFSEDGNSIAGRWQWPGGGYEVLMSRVVSE